MENNKFNCIEANRIDLVDFLSNLGYPPQKVRNNDFWYLSPLRNEKTPSFKVNRSLNRWFDFGDGRGGNLVDFGILYHRCSIGDFLEILDRPSISPKQFPETFSNDKFQEEPKNKLQILAVRPIVSVALLRYLQKRRIPHDIAHQYCKEVSFGLRE